VGGGGWKRLRGCVETHTFPADRRNGVVSDGLLPGLCPEPAIILIQFAMELTTYAPSHHHNKSLPHSRDINRSDRAVGHPKLASLTFLQAVRANADIS
jgi:hypothetical protein